MLDTCNDLTKASHCARHASSCTVIYKSINQAEDCGRSVSFKVVGGRNYAFKCCVQVQKIIIKKSLCA